MYGRDSLKRNSKFRGQGGGGVIVKLKTIPEGAISLPPFNITCYIYVLTNSVGRGEGKIFSATILKWNSPDLKPERNTKLLG